MSCKCGRPSKPGRKCCAACITRALDRRARLLASGLCVNCMAPRAGTSRLCDECRAVQVLKDHARRSQAAAQGKCQFCQAPRTRGVYCEKHYEAVTARDRRRRNVEGPVAPRHCGACGEVGHQARTCPVRRAA